MRCKIYVLTGAPCTGKTSVLNELEKRGYTVLEEETKDASLKLKEWGDNDDFDKIVFSLRRRKIEQIADEEGLFFSDRGVGDSLAYYNLKGLPVPADVLKFAQSVKYAGVFVFESLGIYENNEFRQTPKEKQKEIHDAIVESYKKMDCNLFFVPAFSIEERVSFILNSVKNPDAY